MEAKESQAEGEATELVEEARVAAEAAREWGKRVRALGVGAAAAIAAAAMSGPHLLAIAMALVGVGAAVVVAYAGVQVGLAG